MKKIEKKEEMRVEAMSFTFVAVWSSHRQSLWSSHLRTQEHIHVKKIKDLVKARMYVRTHAYARTSTYTQKHSEDRRRIQA